MSAPPAIDNTRLAKARELLHLGKKASYIADRLQISRNQVIEAGLGDLLRYDQHTDTMTARPGALDLPDGIDAKTITDAAEYAHPHEIPARLQPPKPKTVAKRPTTPPIPADTLRRYDKITARIRDLDMQLRSALIEQAALHHQIRKATP